MFSKNCHFDGRSDRFLFRQVQKVICNELEPVGQPRVRHYIPSFILRFFNKIYSNEPIMTFYLLCVHQQHHKVDLGDQQGADEVRFELLDQFEDHHLI